MFVLTSAPLTAPGDPHRHDSDDENPAEEKPDERIVEAEKELARHAAQALNKLAGEGAYGAPVRECEKGDQHPERMFQPVRHVSSSELRQDLERESLQVCGIHCSFHCLLNFPQHTLCRTDDQDFLNVWTGCG